MNRILDSNGLCNVCVKNERTKTAKDKANAEYLDIDADGDLTKTTKDLQAALDDESAVKPRKLSISMPGRPPSEYSNDEKEIYLAQWTEYKSFYRDPTAKAIVHSIIILEIELNWILSEMICKRGFPVKDLEQQRLRIIRNLSELHSQLPKREANDESDDEKFLSMVYEKYTEELKDRRIGKVARLLTPEALALAPVLHFPLNPQQLLTDLGYRTIDAAQACDQILLADLPAEPERVLEFFGFFLRERYAMPIETQIVVDDEEDILPAVASPAEASPANPDEVKPDDDYAAD